MKHRKAGMTGLVVSLAMGAMLSANAENSPGITRVYPTLGPVGQWVYVSGSNFVKNATTVTVGGATNIPAHVYAAVQLGFTVPVGATGTTHVTVSTTNGTATSTATYTVGIPTNPPAVSSISPLLGPVGQWVYVRGSNFVHGQTQTSVGHVSNITAHVYGPDQLGFRVPTGANGMTHVSVFTPFGAATSPQLFQVGIPTNPPSISHTDEYEGFNWVYVSGDNFVNGQTTIRVGTNYQTEGHVYGPPSLGFTPPTNWYDESLLVLETPFGTATQHMEAASPPITLSRQSTAGHKYQIQSTQDLMGEWTNVGEPITADSDELQSILRSRDKVHFWRAIEVD